MTDGRALPPDREEADGGIWHAVSVGDFAGRPALFLDRDGVIIEDTHYLCRAEDMRLLSGAADAIARCNRLGIPVVVVSNQSGIARGLYDWQGFHTIQAALAAALADAGAHIDAAFACAHHAEGGAPFNVADHPWRKPNPGMILAAGLRMRVDLPRSWIVGDRPSDIAAGRAAGLEGGVLLAPQVGDPQRAAAAALQGDRFRVEMATALADAVSLLLARGRLGASQRGVSDSSATGSRSST